MKALYTSLIFLFLQTTAQAQANSGARFFLFIVNLIFLLILYSIKNLKWWV